MKSQTSAGPTIPLLTDILQPHLAVVFCGINPGLRSAEMGHHFAGRGNRFWRTLHLAGFTPELIAAENDRKLLDYGCGITSAVARPTARADQLSKQEFHAAKAELEAKIARYAPHYIAFLGKVAYSAIVNRQDIQWGTQAAEFGTARVWILPNPSGLNRAFDMQALVQAYRELRLNL